MIPYVCRDTKIEVRWKKDAYEAKKLWADSKPGPAVRKDRGVQDKVMCIWRSYAICAAVDSLGLGLGKY